MGKVVLTFWRRGQARARRGQAKKPYVHGADVIKKAGVHSALKQSPTLTLAGTVSRFWKTSPLGAVLLPSPGPYPDLPRWITPRP